MKIKYWDKSDKTDIRVLDAERNINIGYFKNCVIDGASIHYPLPLIKSNGELLLPTIEMFMSLGRGTSYESDMEWECTNTDTNKIETTPVFYFVYNCANYFHWIYDTVPYLYSYFEEKKKVSNLKLLVSVPEGKRDLYPFVYETLDLLGIKREDLIFLDRATQYETILVGSSLTHNRMSLDPPHKGVFSIINSMDAEDGERKKIYVSRRTWTQPKSDNIGTDYTAERMCVNEDDVVELLRSYGFEEIFCENLSMEEKISVFRSAESVVGPIGGGMSNVLFCKPDTKVISLNSPEFFDINKRLEYALTHTDIYMFNDTKFVDRKDDVITGESALSISGGMNSPWMVDLNKLKECFA
ncbi:MAG TPA: glycosyltransferase family 61 protein [Candidatus Marinimicrobia bacterium]|nr:glycosyltransferase family 61 protein [Candidatus Neomarinimicrobiota bacterium]